MPATPGEIMPVVGQTLFPASSHLTLSGIIIGPILVVGLQFLFYGFYIMSFTVCLIVLKRRPKTKERTFHYTMIISLFVLATLGIVDNTALAVVQAGSYFYQWAGDDIMADHKKTLEMMAHLLPAFRCYAIWDFKRIIIIIPGIACLLSNAIGIVSMAITVSAGLSPHSLLAQWISKSTYLENVYFILNALINVVLTSMVAGKIWMSASQPGDFLPARSKKRYISIASIVFQSGLIYPLVLVISVPFTLFPPLAGWDLYPLLIQFAGICPTLMIVRVGLGDDAVLAPPPVQRDSAIRINFDVGTRFCDQGSWINWK
ncbi:hypothetical protein V5O48_017570 [Marasmius crinis-equi]|uniref:Uncharacterized protein n=1 Tax=Marasmius crinis-equi TaxID=585013 RepID=A0ABR3ENS7_9AGAR